MDLPSQQCKALSQLEITQPYDILINKFRSYQDEMLTLQRNGAQVREEAAKLPELLETHIQELHTLLDKEKEIREEVKKSLAEKRIRDLDRIKDLETEYLEIQGQIIATREEKLNKANTLEQNTEHYKQLLDYNGLSAEQFALFRSLRLQQMLPINIQNNIDMPPDEIWRIIGTFVECEKRQFVPICKLYPEIERALLGAESLGENEHTDHNNNL